MDVRRLSVLSVHFWYAEIEVASKRIYQHVGEIMIPKTTGALSVSELDFHWTDKKRKERHSKSDAYRELAVRAWYPKFPQEQEEALQTTEVERCPVIIFSPGVSLKLDNYLSLLKELASHGYVVFGVEYPYMTQLVQFSDGRTIAQAPFPATREGRWDFVEQEHKVWVEDLKFVLDQLSENKARSAQDHFFKRLDLNRIGIMGHSFGGSASAEVCAIDSRCVASIAIDGLLLGPNRNLTGNKPFMMILATHLPENLPDEAKDNQAKHLERANEVFNQSCQPVYYVEVSGADHLSFGDFYKKNASIPLPPLEPTRGIEITRVLVLGFFDCHLRGIKSAFHSRLGFPEIRLATRNIK